jgi:hypothetical protein
MRRQREDHGMPAGQMRSCCSMTGKAVLGPQSFSTWTTIPSAAGIEPTCKMGGMRLAGCRFCRSTVEIRAHVTAECGQNYSHFGCIKLLARLGFEYRKPKPLPRVASAQMQTAFVAFYARLMRELLADEAVYFAPSWAFQNALPGNGCGASGMPDQACIWLGEGGIKSSGSQHAKARSCGHSWGCTSKPSMPLLSSPQPLMGSVPSSF